MALIILVYAGKKKKNQIKSEVWSLNSTESESKSKLEILSVKFWKIMLKKYPWNQP